MPYFRKEKVKSISVRRYFIYLGYNGKNFRGWQIQPNGMTVQQSIEEALAILMRTPAPIVGAGRTDAGVHAHLMIAHFDWEEPIGDLVFLAEELNRLLPKDIAVYKIVRSYRRRMPASTLPREPINIMLRQRKTRLITSWFISFPVVWISRR